MRDPAGEPCRRPDGDPAERTRGHAALSRLGAVAVLLPPDADLDAAVDSVGSTRTGGPRARRGRGRPGKPVMVLGGGDGRELDLNRYPGRDGWTSSRFDPAAGQLPGWYRPNPGLARELAFVIFTGTGDAFQMKQITNYRWALSAFGTATAAALGHGDTVYCLAPVHHSAGLLASLGARWRAVRGSHCPAASIRSASRRRCTGTASPWWRTPGRCCARSSTIRSFALGRQPSGPPVHRVGHARRACGGARRSGSRPRTVLEFYASTEGDVVLANVSGAKRGAEGRPLPGSAPVCDSPPTTRLSDGSSRTSAASSANARHRTRSGCCLAGHGPPSSRGRRQPGCIRGG